MPYSINDIDYHLPAELIAQSPAEPRDSSRLLVLDRNSREVSHHHFSDLEKILQPGDVIVRNNTKVIPARLFGRKHSGGDIEILLVKPVFSDHNHWQVISKPGLKEGQEVIYPDSNLSLICRETTGMTRVVEFSLSGEDFWQEVDRLGKMPLPPYIHSNQSEQQLRQKYQTTFAQNLGSVAAPTAGLHFTKQLDQELRAKGVEIIELTLHVGLGTFLPVKETDITKHQMHGEWYQITAESVAQLRRAKSENKRIIAVGTTSARTLESVAEDILSGFSGDFQDVRHDSFLSSTDFVRDPRFRGDDKQENDLIGETEIYIYPPYKFKMVDGLITNFHLPKSTLLMMISAFVSEPNTEQEFTNFKNSLAGVAYTAAIDNQYRFYSFGDAMLIL